MPRWMDERERRMRAWDRDRQARERDRRPYGQDRPPGEDYGQADYRAREDRSFSGEGAYGPYDDPRVEEGPGERDRVFGERETGASYDPGSRPYDPYRWRRPAWTERGARYGADYRYPDYGRGWRGAGQDHSSFGFGHDLRGTDYDRDFARGREPDRGGGDYIPNVREGRGEGGRSWWDRTRDQVTSWFGDHEAERRREWDLQMGGHRGRGPKGYRRSDERISEEVHERLTDDPWVDASGIQIAVVSGEVTLSGATPDRETKHRAEQIVEAISGVDHVQNNLRPARSGNYFTRAGAGFGDSAETRRQDEAGSLGPGRGKGAGNA